MSNIHGGDLIRACRSFRGLTQNDVARLYGVAVRTLQRWETKKAEPTFSETRAVCEEVCKVDLALAMQLQKGISV